MTFMTNFRAKIILCLLLIAVASLGACGKRATRLYPPDEDDTTTEPVKYRYPDPATDPKPQP